MLYNIFIQSSGGEGGFGETVFEVIDKVSIGIEVLAVSMIVVAVLFSLIRYLIKQFGSTPDDEVYLEFRHGLAKSLLLGLEMLIAADIIRTVALEASVQSVSVLGFLVLIRTFLSWSLVVEIDGHWPWQA